MFKLCTMLQWLYFEGIKDLLDEHLSLLLFCISMLDIILVVGKPTTFFFIRGTLCLKFENHWLGLIRRT